TDVTAPTITNPGTQYSSENVTVSLGIGATDSDSDPLTYGASGLPADLLIDSSTGLISGIIAVGASSGSPYSVTVTVSDGHSSASTTFTGNVAPSTPAVDSPGTQNSNEGDAISLQISATDPNTLTLTLSATGLPAGLSINSSTGLISGTIGNQAANNSP